MSSVSPTNLALDLDRMEGIREEVAREPERLAADPQAFFSSLGVQIDTESAAAIQRHLEARRMASRQRSIQASAIHVDV